MTSNDIQNALKIFLGSTQAKKLYIGSTLIYQDSSSSLPYDAELEYLESTGTQYIKSGIINNDNVSVELKMSASGTNCLSGGELDNANNNKYKFGADGNGYVYFGIGPLNNTSSRKFTLDSPCTFYISKGSQSVIDEYGKQVLSGTSSVETYSPYDITLFRFRQGTKFINTSGNTRIFYCNIIDGNNSMELIPVRVGQVGYLYDKISGQLFENQGTGDFVLGPDKGAAPYVSNLPSGYTELKWIKSTATGGQYIDLNIKLYETLNTDYDIAIKAIHFGKGLDNTQPTLFGCQNETSPWPGTFIREGSNNYMVGRYIGGTSKDNNITKMNTVFELPVQTPPNKDVTSVDNGGQTHNYGTSLFCAFTGSNSSPYRYAEAAIHYFKLFVEGVLVRDMIPCRDPNNIVGLYDLVNDVFYSSPNGNAFVAGPEINKY